MGINISSEQHLSDEMIKKFYEVVLTKKDFNSAKIELDLFGFPTIPTLDDWLKTYYNCNDKFDPYTMTAPDFDPLPIPIPIPIQTPNQLMNS